MSSLQLRLIRDRQVMDSRASMHLMEIVPDPCRVVPLVRHRRRERHHHRRQSLPVHLLFEILPKDLQLDDDHDGCVVLLEQSDKCAESDPRYCYAARLEKKQKKW